MNINTPAYIFHAARFREQQRIVKEFFGNIPITYSIKANPVLLGYITDDISHVEVCSPGEFEICRNTGTEGSKIIYSGVLKKKDEVREALNWNVDIITAESTQQVDLINELCEELGKQAKVLIRVSSGNQFGVSQNDLYRIIKDRKCYSNIIFTGIHYYSGTQKKLLQMLEEDMKILREIDDRLRMEYHFDSELIEYGPGLAVDYFSANVEELEEKRMGELRELIDAYGMRDKLGLEFGRLLAASCGEYRTTVSDIKETNGIRYLITDGGTHHLRYYGQNMGMRIPPVTVMGQETTEKVHYCVCGSLCTVSDVLVRDVELPVVDVGDVIVFHYCGSYSSTESPALFLSRNMPELYVVDEDGMYLIRTAIATSEMNVRIRQDIGFC